VSKKPTIRFAFTIKDGPNAGLTSGTWRAWTHGEDLYIAPEELSKVWKVSLHADAAWRVAMTSEHVREGVEPQLPHGVDRAVWKFRPPPFEDGGRLAFVVAVTRASLLPGVLDERALHIAVKDRWDVLNTVKLWMTEPNVEMEGSSRPLGAPLPLRSGRRVWLSVGTEPVEGNPEPPCVGSIIEPMSPATHEVTAPGVMVKGVHTSHD
jgi:hypothetical protein